jgi:arginyl-tRNA--protein-N-Asp/Glu arginylyltransferase
MKIFSSELAQDYSTYTFGYANYCKRETGDVLDSIYTTGYLPYSGTRGVMDLFYMARSARVPLKKFALTSENRRIAKKFDGVFTKARIPFAEFVQNEAFYTFCLEYFAKRHGTVMPRERLELILGSNLITHIVEYREEKVVAYVFEVRTEECGHYWYSFYDLLHAQQSLGLWLMLDCVRDAQQDGCEYYYLGTVYGEKALYKTNFEPLEWWDGKSWLRNIKLLKERGRTDATRTIARRDLAKEEASLF